MATFNCIIDASVGIKLFLVETYSEAVDWLFDRLYFDPGTHFYIPDLFFVECANILWKYVRYNNYPADNARQDVQDLQALRLQTVSTADLLTPAFDLAIDFDLTAYDACYAALAQQLDLPLITADRPLVRKLAGSSVDARFIGDLFNAEP